MGEVFKAMTHSQLSHQFGRIGTNEERRIVTSVVESEDSAEI